MILFIYKENCAIMRKLLWYYKSKNSPFCAVTRGKKKIISGAASHSTVVYCPLTVHQEVLIPYI